jgi:hypothetical protein
MYSALSYVNCKQTDKLLLSYVAGSILYIRVRLNTDIRIRSHRRPPRAAAVRALGSLPTRRALITRILNTAVALFYP